MNIIDTHSHIYSHEFDLDRDELITRAKNIGISEILLPNVDLESINPLLNTVEKYPDFCYPMMGIHPTSISNDWIKDLDIIEKHLKYDKTKYIAVGEIGIDLYWDKTYQLEQIKAFETQLQWATELNLPASVHSRESYNEVIESINKFSNQNLRGVIHSFTGSQEDLNKIKKLESFYIGINGVVTYKNSNLREILKTFPIERIILETDAPYLPPVPYRGKRNEPAYLEFIIKELTEIYKLTPEKIAETTTKNARNLFNL